MDWPLGKHGDLDPLRQGQAVGNSEPGLNTNFAKDGLWTWRYQTNLKNFSMTPNTFSQNNTNFKVKILSILACIKSVGKPWLVNSRAAQDSLDHYGWRISRVESTNPNDLKFQGDLIGT